MYTVPHNVLRYMQFARREMGGKIVITIGSVVITSSSTRATCKWMHAINEPIPFWMTEGDPSDRNKSLIALPFNSFDGVLVSYRHILSAIKMIECLIY